MADKKNWDRSDSFIYTWRNSEGKKEYYAAQLIFCNKTESLLLAIPLCSLKGLLCLIK